MELLLFILGLGVFWFFFGLIASKQSKRPYDEDTSIKDGAKSVGFFFIVIGGIAVLFLIMFILGF